MIDLTLSGGRPDIVETLRGGLVRVHSRRGVRLTERLLIEALPKEAPVRLLSGFDAEGVVALAAASLWPETDVVWRHFDAYVAAKVKSNLQRHDCGRSIDAAAAPDLPGFVGRGGEQEEPFDVVALPLGKGTESLLVREFAEQAHDVLRVGGVALFGTDQDATPLRDVAKAVFGKADAMRDPAGGAVVRAVRSKEKTAWKEHAHVLRVPFEGRVLELESRPGTFSYGRLDRGTKALMGTLPGSIPRGARVVDLGCGHGALGLCALVAAPEGRALLVDSNARAIDLAVRNAARNGLSDRAEAVVRSDFERLPQGAFDLALANPPYFGDFRIAESFVGAAYGCLVKGGELRLVAMAAEEHAAIVRRSFQQVRIEEIGEYGVVRAVVL